MDEHDPIDTTAQDKQQVARDKAIRLALKTEQADFKWLMATAQGRRIVWRQLASSGVFRSVFDSNAMQMAFLEGQRHAGLRLLAQVHELCPELYSTMTQENQQ